jgi:pentose-5-phosphate-3-epimerase
MTHATRIAAWRDRYPGRIAGSVYTVPAAERAGTARELADAGLDVHVDMMASDEGLPVGVGLDELRDIAAVVDRTRIGVQLIGSEAYVDEVLPAVLDTRPARVFLPWDAFSADRVSAVRAAGVQAWISVWLEWDGVGTPPWPTAPDGALVMLIEPGTAGSSWLSQLAVAAACVQQVPVHVDGGVTEDVAPLCVTAGAESMVVGRALLGAAERRAM